MGAQNLNPNQPKITVENHFEIEEKMGDGSWEPVIDNDYDYEHEIHRREFTSKDDAEKYIGRNYRYHPENARIVGSRSRRPAS